MSFIHIKKRTVERDGMLVEVFAVPAISIAAGQGRKLIPNPAGTEACIFQTLEEAERAIKRAGFDYIYEGKKTYTLPMSQADHPAVAGPVSLQDAVPILVKRLGDREFSVIANAAYALGELDAEEAVEELSMLLGHEDAAIRKNVGEALAKIGEAALPVLKSAYHDARHSQEKNARQVRLTVISAYLELTHYHRELLGEVLPQAVEALQDESWLVRAQAALVIGQSAQFFKSENF